jgi:hypothetical protein
MLDLVSFEITAPSHKKQSFSDSTPDKANFDKASDPADATTGNLSLTRKRACPSLHVFQPRSSSLASCYALGPSVDGSSVTVTVILTGSNTDVQK